MGSGHKNAAAGQRWHHLTQRVVRFPRRLAKILLLLLFYNHPVLAADTVTYAIDSQPLATALLAYAEQSDLQIMFRSEELPDTAVAPLYGDYPATRALAKLLEHTGLTYRFGGGDVLVIYRHEAVAVKRTPAGKQSDDIAVEEVLVTGIRSSLARSLTIKHHANPVMDVITAEDIGKFPDKNIADSLQRIPGVSIDRIWGEGRDINIRGTDKNVNRTLMNGQNVASAYWWADDNPSRGFNYSILASELIASLEVRKSPQADIDEGSIGGTVIIRTRKPLDLAAGILRTSLEQQYSELPGQWDPQAAVLFSWKNRDDTFGALASFNLQHRTLRRDGLEAFPDNTLHTLTESNGNRIEGVQVPWGMGSAIFRQERKRNTGNLTLQWTPGGRWDITFNSVVTRMDMDNSNQNYLALPGAFKLAEIPPAPVSEAKIDVLGGVKMLRGGTFGNPDSPGAALDAIFRNAYVETAVYDLDVNYAAGNWRAHWQTGFTEAEGGSDHDRRYLFVGNTRQTFHLGPRQLDFSFADLDPRDAAALDSLSSESRDWIRAMGDAEFYLQGDLSWDLGPFAEVKVGAKWRDHSIENNRSVGLIDTSHPDWAAAQHIGLDRVSNGLSPHLHRKTASAGSLTRYAWADRGKIGQVLQPLFDNGLLEYRYDRTAFYEINERVLGLYVKADFETDKLHGDFGLRLVNTEQRSKAYQNNQPVAHFRRYHNYLPSLNLAYRWTENVILRAAAARVMARPNFQDITPGIIIDATDGTALGGNPNLKPLQATQIDLGIEWYFAEASVLSAAYFHKDLSTFVDTRTLPERIDGRTLSITRPYNTSGADIRGIELQWQQDLSAGFGIISNYTYTDASVASPSRGEASALPGNSRDQLNSSVYFENSTFSARLSYNYRSDSFGGLNAGSQDVTEAYDQWDAAVRWTPSPPLSLYLEGVNLGNEPIYSRTANGIPQGFYENGRRFVVGISLAL